MDSLVAAPTTSQSTLSSRFLGCLAALLESAAGVSSSVRACLAALFGTAAGGFAAFGSDLLLQGTDIS